MNINEIMAELVQYTRLQEEAVAMVDSLKDTVKQYMTDNQLEILTGTEHKAMYKAIYKAVTSSRIGTTALKKEHPDIATAYTRATETKRFTFA